MSADRLDPLAQSDVPSDEWDPAFGASTSERRLEALAEEVGRVIEEAPREEREALRDYAVSLIRDRTDGGDHERGVETDWGDSEQPPTSPESSSSAATLIGYGALLVPAGGLLALVLPPIGLMLGMTAFAMIAAGIALSIIARIRGSFS